jgi:hypothetical protein
MKKLNLTRVGCGVAGSSVNRSTYTYIYVLTRWGRLGGDSGGAVKLGPGLSFSWKRALGVTKAKRRVSKKTGIPLSRGGRRMKLGKWMGMK